MKHAAPRRHKRQISLLVLLVVLVATPATLALSYYRLTGDPTFRPLAITVERLVAGGHSVESATIRIDIHAASDPQAQDRAKVFAGKLKRAFYGKGLDTIVFLHPSPDHTGPPLANLRVERHNFGPYNERNATHGVRIAAEAVQVKARQRAAARPHRW